MRALVLFLVAVAAIGATDQRTARIGKGGKGRPGSSAVVDCSLSTVRCVPSEYATIQLASNATAAGDTVYVAAGTYTESGSRVSVAASGTSGSPITYLAASGVTTCGFLFSAKSYVRVVGFTLDASTSGCTSNAVLVLVSGSNTGLEFWNNTLQNTNAAGGVYMVAGTDACNKCIVIGNTFQHIGTYGTTDSCATGCTSTSALDLTGDDELVAYNYFTDICYIGVNQAGTRHRYVNNNFDSLVQCNGTHPDFQYPQINDATPYNDGLWEASYGIGTSTASDNKGMHLQNSSSSTWNRLIWRFNVIRDMGAGYYSVYGTGSAINNVRFYNDTVVRMSLANTTSAYNNGGNISNTVTAKVWNTIFVDSWSEAARNVGGGGVVGVSISGGATVTTDYNLLYDPDGTLTNWMGDAHPQSNVNPLFTNATSDFTLQSLSGARGVGGALTTASGAGTNSTALTVASNDGSYFIGDNSSNLTQYSGALVPGDPIRVGTCNTTVSSVSGDNITLASQCTWSNGASVYYGDTSTIDIGAYPYKAGGYTLTATYSNSSGTITVAPNDAALVRFVVCYNNGAPYSIDSSSPYTCAAPSSGVFTARVYPRYPSQTRWVVAQ